MSDLAIQEQVGILCVVAAAVGGGLKLLHHEIRPIASIGRQIVLALIGLSLIAWGNYDRGGPMRTLFPESPAWFCLNHASVIRPKGMNPVLMPAAIKTCSFASESSCKLAANNQGDSCVPDPGVMYCFDMDETLACYISPSDCSSVAHSWNRSRCREQPTAHLAAGQTAPDGAEESDNE